MSDWRVQLPTELPCFFTDHALTEWNQLPGGVAKDEVLRLLKNGFPWYSVDFGPIRREGWYIEWDIQNPDARELEIDVGDGTAPPDIYPLGYRVYGQIVVERPGQGMANAYFRVHAVREIIRAFR